MGAGLSDPASAIDRWLSPRRPVRSPRAPDWAVAVGAPRPAIHRREPAGGFGQYRHRGGHPCAHRRPYAPSGGSRKRDFRCALRQAQLYFRSRHCADCRHQQRPFVMEVNPAIPVHTVPEFIAYTRVRPGQINFASPGIGTTIHLSGELFNIMTGVKMVHVPYRGNAPALTDLIAGQVQMMFADTPSSIEHVKS